jgi:hypothetical protein
MNKIEQTLTAIEGLPKGEQAETWEWEPGTKGACMPRLIHYIASNDLKELAAHVRKLTEALGHCINAIETLPPDALGVGSSDEGTNYWYFRDELLGRSRAVLQENNNE